tara:strand:+ start:1010 stop:2767 length:1758 start_codon:yes stop_codon:yes gene_type:complete
MKIKVNRNFRKKSRKKTIGGAPPDNETLLNTFVQIKKGIHTEEQENVKIDFFKLTHLNPYNTDVPSVHDMYYLRVDAKAEKYELLHISFDRFRRIGIGGIANSAYAGLNHIARAYYDNKFDLTEKSVDGSGNIVTLLPYSENYLQDLKNMRQDLINANNGNNPAMLNAIDNMTSEIEVIGHRVELFKTLIAIEGAKNIHRRKRESVNYQLASFPEDISNELAKFQFGGSNIPEPEELINIFLEKQNTNMEEVYDSITQKLSDYNNNVEVWNKYTLDPRMRNIGGKIEFIHSSFRRFKLINVVTPEGFANMYWGGFYTLNEKSVDSYGNVVNLLQYAEKYVEDLENNTDYTDAEKEDYKNVLDVIRTLSAIKDARLLPYRTREARNYELANFPTDISNEIANFQFGGGKKVLGMDLIENKFYKVLRFQYGQGIGEGRSRITGRREIRRFPRHIIRDSQGRNRPYISYAKYIGPLNEEVPGFRSYIWSKIVLAQRERHVNTEIHDFLFNDELNVPRRIFEDIHGNIFIISEHHVEGPDNEFHEILPSDLEKDIQQYPIEVAKNELQSKSQLPEELIGTIADMSLKND